MKANQKKFPVAANIAGSKGIFGGKQPKTPREDPDSLSSRAMVSIVDLISEGRIGGLVDGAKSIYLDDTPLQNADGTNNFEGFTWDFRDGAQLQDALGSKFDAVETPVVVGVQVKKDSPSIVTITNPNVDQVRMIVAVGALMRQFEKSGNIEGTSVQFRFEVSYNGGSYSTVGGTKAITGKSRSRYQRAYVINLERTVGGAPVTSTTIRMVRETDDSANSKMQNDLFLDSYSEIVSTKMAYPNSALVGVSIDSAQFSNVPTRHYHVYGILIKVPSNYNHITREYNGVWSGTFKLAPSDNPAWILYDVITNNRYGLGDLISKNSINIGKLYEIGRYCDGMIDDGFGKLEPRFTINTAISTAVEAYRLIMDISSVFNGMTYWSGSTADFMYDAPTEPVMLFNNANVVGDFGRAGADLKDRHTVVLVTWNDPEQNYRQTVEYVEDETLIKAYGYRKAEIVAFGCCSRGQAVRVGKWLLYTERYQSEVINFTVGLDAALVLPGDLIKIHDQHRAGKRIGGRLKQFTQLSAELDQKLTTLDANSTISIRLASGKFVDRLISSITQNASGTTTVKWALTVTDEVVPNAVWVIATPNLKPELARVVAINGGDSAATLNITAIPHNPNKYLAIENNIVLEQPKTSVLDRKAQVAPASVTISQNATVVQGINVTTMTISWEQAAGAVSYRVMYRKGDGNWILLPETGALSIDIENVYAGKYIAKVIAISPTEAESIVVYSSLTDIGGKTSAPASITGMVVTGLLFGMRIEWGFPVSGAEDTAHTEIRYATEPNAEIANSLGLFAFPTNVAIQQGLIGGLTLHYQARLIDRLGNEGPWSAWVSGTSSEDAAAIIDMLEGQIGSTALSQALGEKVEQIDVNTQSIAKEVIDRKDSAVAEATARVAAINAEASARSAAITNESANRANAIAVEVSNRSQALADEAAARGTAIAAEATARRNAITAETTARGTAIAAEATRTNTAISTAISSEVSRTNTAIAAETTARGTAIAKESADRKAAILVETNARGTAIAAETTARGTAIAAEATARGTAIAAEATRTNNAISAETTARTAAILVETNNRKTALADEATARTNALSNEATLRTSAIAAETADRKVALTTEASARTAAITVETDARTAAIAAETTARTSAVTQLQNGITNEATTRIAGDKVNADALTNYKSSNDTALANVQQTVNTAVSKGNTNASAITALDGRLVTNENKATANASAVSQINTTIAAQGSNIANQSSQITSLTNLVNSDRDSDSLAADYLMKNPLSWDSHYGRDLTPNFVTTETGKVSKWVMRRNASDGVSGFWNYNNSRLPSGKKYRVSVWIRRSTDATGTIHLIRSNVNLANVRIADGYANQTVTVPTDEQWYQVTAVFDVTSNTYPMNCFGVAINHPSGAGWAEAQGFRVSEVIGASDTDSTIASSAALSTLDSKVTVIDGKVTSQGTQITTLNNSLTTLTTEVSKKATSATVSALDSKVTTQGNTITSQGGLITGLTNSLSTLSGQVANKAESSALNTLDSKVTQQGADISSQGTQITTLNNSLATLNDKTDTKADASALNALDSKVTSVDGRVTSNSGSITTLDNTLSTLTSEVATKATSAALSTLDSKVTQQGGDITTQSGQITALNSGLSTLTGTVNTKANSSALNTLDSKVTTIDGKVTTNTSNLTTLTGRVATTENNIAKKADATALNDYYTKTAADTATAGQITAFNASLVIGGVNQVIDSERERISSNPKPEYFLYEGSAWLKSFYEENLGKPITISFEIKVAVAGVVSVYASNGSAHRFSTVTPTLVADVWTKVVVTVTPLTHLAVSVSTLEFYGTYDTGRIPTVRKVQVEAGNKATAWSLSPRDIKASLDANASAITTTNAEVTRVNGVVVSQSGLITQLRNDLTTTNTNVGTKASAASLDALSNTVTQQGGTLTSQGTKVTSLENSLSTLTGTVNTKADATALNALDSKVTGVDGRVTANSGSITSLAARVSTTEGNIATKADATALNNYYTKAQADTAIAGKVSEFKATLKTGGDNLLIGSNTPLIKNVGTSAYLVGSYTAGEDLRGRTMTVVACISVDRGTSTTGELYAYQGSGVSMKFDNFVAETKGSTKAIVYLTTAWNTGANIGNGKTLSFYWYPSNTETSKPVAVTVHWAAIYEGVVMPTAAWEQSPYDTKALLDANAAAISTTNTEVSRVNGVVTSQGQDITQLKNNVTTINGDIATKADATALNTLDNKVTAVDGRVTSNSGSITALDNSLSSLTSEVATKASSAALSSLGSTVTQQGGVIESQGGQITTLNNGLSSLTGVVNTKADSSALNTLDSKVTTQGGQIASQGTAVTKLDNQVSNIGGKNIWSLKSAAFVNERGATVRTAIDELNEHYRFAPTSFVTNIALARNDSMLVANAASELTQGASYVLSFKIRASKAASISYYAYIGKSNSPSTGISLNLTTEWLEVVVRFDLGGLGFNSASQMLGFSAASTQFAVGDWYEVKEVSLQKGEVKTNFSPAPQLFNVELGTKATSSALTALDSKVTTQGSTVTSQGGQITTLNNSLSTLTTTVGTKANSTVVSALDSKVTGIDGRVTTNSSSITSLNNSLSTLTGTVNTKADSSALTTLDNKVTTVDGKVTTQAGQITTLQGNVTTINNNVAQKADSSTVSALDSKVTTIDGKVTTQAGQITTLQGNVTTINESIATKADATALNNYYTKTQADTAIAGQVSTYDANLVIGGVNLLRETDKTTSFVAWNALSQIATTLDTRPTFTIKVTNTGTGAAFGFVSASNLKTSSIVQGRTYTLSLIGQGSFESLNYVHLMSASKGNFKLAVVPMTAGNADAVCKTTFVAPYTANDIGILIGASGIGADAWFEVRGLNLEEGNKATSWSPSVADTKSALDANATAITATNTEVSRVNGVVTSQGSSITALQNSLTTVNGVLNTKASSDAVSALDSKVTTIDGKVTTQAGQITTLQGNVSTINGAISTKADSTALNNYYTKTQADTAIAGKVSEYDANLVIGGVNLISNSNAVTQSNNSSTPLMTFSKGANSCFITNTSNNGAVSTYTPVFFDTVIGKRYTVSVKVKPSLATKVGLFPLGVGSTTINSSNDCPKDVWTTLWCSFIAVAASTRLAGFVASSGFANGVVVEYKEYQAEEGSKVTSWSPSVADTKSALDANASAITITNTEVTRVNGVVVSQGQDITQLKNSVTTINGSIATRADASAVTALTNRVTAAEGVNTTQSTNITTLTNALATTDGKVATKAESSALSTLDSKVTGIDGRVTSNSGSITTLNNSLNTLATDVGTKATSTALSALDSKVTQQGDTLTTQSGQITTLNNGLSALSGTVNTKADSSALSTLDNKVTSIDGRVTSNSGSITALNNSLAATNLEVNKKATSAALSTLDSKVTGQGNDLTSQSSQISSLTNLVSSDRDSDSLTADYSSKNGTCWDSHYNHNLADYIKPTTTGIVSNSVFRKDETKASTFWNYNNTRLPTGKKYRVSMWVRRSANATGTCYITRSNVDTNNVRSNEGYSHVIITSQVPGDENWYLATAIMDVTSHPFPFVCFGFAINHSNATGWAEMQGFKVTAVVSAADTDATLATSAALSTLDSKVTTIDGRVTTNSSSITSLNNALAATNNNVATKAASSALTALDSKVTGIDGRVTTNSSSITSLNNSLATTNTNVATKAATSALNTLDSKVTGIDGRVTTNSSSITTLNNSLATTNNNVATKANASALTALDSKVTSIDGRVTSNTNAVTSLQGSVTTINGTLVNKADSAALNNYYTKTEADNAVAGSFYHYDANLIIGGSNILRGTGKVAGYEAWGTGSQITATLDTQPTPTFKTANTAVVPVFGIHTSGPNRTSSIVQGKTYTLSFIGQGSLQTLDQVHILSGVKGNSQLPNIALTAGDPNAVCKISFVAPYTANDIGILVGASGTGNGAWFEIRGLNLENGTRATSWSPSSYEVDSALNANSSAINATNSEVARVNGIVTSHTSDITQLRADLTTTNNGVATKVSTTVFNALDAKVTTIDGKVTGQASSISQLNATVANKADASALNSYYTKAQVDSASVNTANSVSALLADKASVQQFNNLSANAQWLDGRITANATNVSTLSSQINENKTQANAAIQQLSNTLTAADAATATQVQSISAAIDGASNMLVNGSFEDGIKHWYINGGAIGVTGISENGWGSILSGSSAPNDSIVTVDHSRVSVAPNTQYTLSGDSLLYCSSGLCYFDVVGFATETSSEVIFDSPEAVVNGQHDFADGLDRRRAHAVTFTTPSNCRWLSVRFVFKAKNVNAWGCRQVKLARGDRVTFYDDGATVANTTASLTATASRVDQVVAKANANAGSIVTEAQARADAVSALGSQINQVSAQAGANAGSIATEAQARANGDSALSSQIQQVSAQAGANAGSIVTEAQARANAISSVVSQIGTLNSKVAIAPNMLLNGSFESGKAGWATPAASNAYISVHGWGSILTGNTAPNRADFTVESQRFPVAPDTQYTLTGDSLMFCQDNDGYVYFDVVGFAAMNSPTNIYDSGQNVVSGTHDFSNDFSRRQAHALTFTTPSNVNALVVRVVFFGKNITAWGCRQIKLSKGSEVTLYDDGVTLNYNSASIQTQQSTINGLSAQYTVKLDVNGYVSGFGMANSGKSADFIINADRFAIGKVGAGSISYPFIFTTSPTEINGTIVPAGAYIKSAYIHDGSIDVAKINKASITSLSAISATIGNFRSSTGNKRVEISDNGFKMFDDSGVLRIELGDF